MYESPASSDQHIKINWMWKKYIPKALYINSAQWHEYDMDNEQKSTRS